MKKFNRNKFLKISIAAAASFAVEDSIKNLYGNTNSSHFRKSRQIREVITTCNMCYLGCSVIATCEGENILHLRGNPISPINKGKLCAKGHGGIYKPIHPERIGSPLIRSGKRGAGKWKVSSWENALGVVSDSLSQIKRNFGGESIALWQNVNMDRPDIFKRFIYALESPNFISHVSTCNSSQLIGGALTSGVARQNYDFENAECIVCVGINPFAAKELVYSTRKIMEAKSKGVKLVTLDPRQSETAAKSDLWIPIRSGTDGIFLAGLANWLIQNKKYDAEYVRRYTFGFYNISRYLQKFTVKEVCKITEVPEKMFLETANLISHRRTIVASGRGLITHIDATDAMRMSEILNALLGSFDRKGGVLLMDYPPFKSGSIGPEIKTPSIKRIDESSFDKIALPVGLKGKFPASFFGLSHNVPDHILSGKPYQLQSIIFNSVNPVYSLPEGGKLALAFDKLKLIVSIDAFMTETTQYADVVLPASTYLEGLDLWMPQGVKVALRQPVIKPKLDTLPSQEIILLLAKKMNLSREFPFEKYEDYIRAELNGSGISYDELKLKGYVSYNDDELKPGKLLSNGFKTASGKIELISSVLSYSGFSPLPNLKMHKKNKEFPYDLITYKLPFHTQSATGENPYLASIKNNNPALIHSILAKKLQVVDGDRVEIESVRGKIIARIKISEGIRPDSIALSHHFGHTAYSNICNGRGVNANSIIHTGTDPLGGNATYNDTKVRIKKYDRL